MRKITLLPLLVLVLAACGVTTPSSSTPTSTPSTTSASTTSTATSTSSSSASSTPSSSSSSASSSSASSSSAPVSSVISIQDARQRVEGADVSVRGVVTRVMRQKNFFIQQGDFAITVFGYEGSETIVEGDFVEVYGFIGNYFGLVQLTGAAGSGLPEVTKLTGTAPTITPLELTESTYDSETLKLNNDGRLISIKGLKLSASFTPLVIDQSQATGNANATFKLGAKNVDGRFDRYINVPGRQAINTFFNGMTTTTKFDYEGILGEFSTGIQLQVTDDSDFTLNTDPAVLPTAVTVTSPITPAEVVVGLGLQLGTTVLPENADDKSVTWSSSDTAIATVSSTGLVSGVSVGTAVITATSVASNLVTGTISVSVTPAPLTLEGVEFGVGDQSLKVGQSIDSEADLLPLGYVGQGITYTSSDTAVATVTSAGVIEARAAGTATITAAATEDNTKTDTVSIIVEDVNSIALVKSADLNTPVTVNGLVTRVLAQNMFYIQNGDIGTQVYGYAGSLTVAANDFIQVSGEVKAFGNVRQIGGTVSVATIDFLTSPTITPLIVTENDYDISVLNASNFGRLIQIEGLQPSNWTNLPLTGGGISRTFSLGAKSISVRFDSVLNSDKRTEVNTFFTDFWKNDTVTYTGVLNAFSSDATFITSELQLAVANVSDFTLVEADPVLVTSITVSGAAGATSLAANGQLQLTAAILPANADVLNVTWSSGNASIATIDANGLVSGVSAGTVTMTATSAEVGSSVVGTLELTVIEPLVLTAIELTASSADVAVGKTLQLNVSPTPSAWVGTYTFSSSDLTKATVSNLGVVTGVALGSVIITATSVETQSISNTINLSVIVETSLYSTGFESSETFTAGTTYNNTLEALRGPAGQQWAFYYGTPSTTTPIVGLQSAQMRFYTTATANLGYARTNFNVTDANYVTFDATSGAASLSVIVSISKDGGVTWTNAETIALTTTLANYKYVVPADKVAGNTQFKFQLTVSNTAAANRLYLDTINIVKVER